jgi:hypothetical protein
MVPKAVQDAGYTAVGLGVLALQHVQVQRRSIARQASAVIGGMKAKATPVTSRLTDLPRLPGPVGRLLEGGKTRLCTALRPTGG